MQSATRWGQHAAWTAGLGRPQKWTGPKLSPRPRHTESQGRIRIRRLVLKALWPWGSPTLRRGLAGWMQFIRSRLAPGDVELAVAAPSGPPTPGSDSKGVEPNSTGARGRRSPAGGPLWLLGLALAAASLLAAASILNQQQGQRTVSQLVTINKYSSDRPPRLLETRHFGVPERQRPGSGANHSACSHDLQLPQVGERAGVDCGPGLPSSFLEGTAS